MLEYTFLIQIRNFRIFGCITVRKEDIMKNRQPVIDEKITAFQPRF